MFSIKFFISSLAIESEPPETMIIVSIVTQVDVRKRALQISCIVMRVKIKKDYVQLVFYISLIERNFKYKTLYKYH